MFKPPRCPFTHCQAHVDPDALEGRFYNHNGAYLAKCRSQPVPRFKCRLCGGGFSRQTFRMDYCDKKPHLNGALFRLLASGTGLRQSARLLSLSRRCTELKARKISRHLGRLNELADGVPGPGGVRQVFRYAELVGVRYRAGRIWVRGGDGRNISLEPRRLHGEDFFDQLAERLPAANPSCAIEEV